MIPRKPKYKRFTVTTEENVYEKFTVFLPKSMMSKLRFHSDRQSLPVSKILSFAVDKESMRSDAFEFDASLPTGEFVKKIPYGLGLDSLLLFKQEIGINNNELFLHGFRELLDSGMIEGFYPSRSEYKYEKTYRYYRAVKQENRDKAAK